MQNKTNNVPIPVCRYTDIHSHTLFGIDDGAANLEMSLAMLKSMQQQGVKNVFCTSHSDFLKHNPGLYTGNFNELKRRAEEELPEISLYTGCEIFCCNTSIETLTERLNSKVYPTLAGSKYALLEFNVYTAADDCVNFVKCVYEHSEYVPVIAHAERYTDFLYNTDAYAQLKSSAIPIQVNAYSLTKEHQPDIKALARKFLADKMVTFLGSDAHRINHRPPYFAEGAEYICNNCDKAYADAVCFGNAEKLLLVK